MSALRNSPRPAAPAEGDLYDPSMPKVDFRFELYDGRIVRKPIVAEQLRWANILSDHLAPAVRSAGAGECYVDVGFMIPRCRSRKPDVSVLGYSRWPAGRPFPPGDFVPTSPSLAVEVVSPHDTADEVTAKRREYLRGGVRLVWLVYPDQAEVQVFGPTGQAHMLSRGDMLTAEPVVPGFALPLADLFPTHAEEQS